MEDIDKVRRLIRPEALKKDVPLVWSSGTGTDVWEMFCACITGDLDAVRRLLDKDPSLARSLYEYRTPLSFAVREKQVGVAALLLERGADRINSGTPDTLLQIARDRGYAEMQALLESALAGSQGTPKGATVAEAIQERDLAKVRSLLDTWPGLLRAVDERTNEPIHWAVMTRQLEMVDELLARGADINARRSDGARPLHLTNGDYTYRGWRDVPKDVVTTPDEVYKHLVARGAFVNIEMAAVKGDLARVRELLDQDASLANRLSDYGSYYPGCGAPIKNAAAAGHIEIVKLLLERGADPNLPEEGIAPRGHALHSAVCNGHIDIVRLLLEHGAHPNVEIESSADTLSAAIRNDDQTMIDLLCSHGAARAVQFLAYYNDLQTAAAVFAANPAKADDPEALANAASQGHEAFVRLLLRCQPDLARRMPFHPWSIGAATPELNEILFQHGMDPNRPNWLRITALHLLAGKGDVENAAIFIDHGADLNARDEEFRSTPLGYAAKYGKAAMVELLLRRGARPKLPDDPPWATPLAWAILREHNEIVRLLT
jgi:ankyrin repeat protein